MTSRGALVGRQAELGELEAALERARLGNGSLVLLAGESGVGKTRLAAALAEGTDALVLSGRADPHRRRRRTRRSSPRCAPTCARSPTAWPATGRSSPISR